MSSKSVETYKKSLVFLSKVGAIIGSDVLSEDFQLMNWRAAALFIDIITYTFVTIFCVSEFFDELEKLVFCLVTYGFATQVRLKQKYNLQ